MPRDGKLDRADADEALAFLLTALFTLVTFGFLFLRWLVHQSWKAGRRAWRWLDLTACVFVAGVVALWLWPFLPEVKVLPGHVRPAPSAPIVAILLVVTGVWFWRSCQLPAVRGWFDRKAESRLRLKEAAAWYRAAAAAGLEGPKAVGFVAEGLPGNISFELELPVGVTAADVEKAEPGLKQWYPAHPQHGRPRDVQVHPASVSALDRVQVRVIRQRAYDEQSGVVRWHPGDPVALREDGEGWTPPFPGYSYLVVGQAGAGKSGWLNTFIAHTTTVRFPVVRWGVDLKQVELDPWRPRFNRLAITYASVSKLLEEIPGVLDERYEFMRVNRIRKWTPGCGLPALLVVVDELREVVQPFPGEKDGNPAKQRLLNLVTLTSKGRACGAILLGATQNPLADIIGRVRDNCGGTICGWVRTETEAFTALGDIGRYLEPQKIQVPGEAWIVPSGDLARGPFKARARFLDDEAVARVAGPRRGEEVVLP
jgi:hypothetical protein